MVKVSSGLLSFPAEVALLAQALRSGHVAGSVGFFPALPAMPGVVSSLSWRFFSAVRRCFVRLRLLLYAAEVALKLQVFTSTGGFFQVRFGVAESLLAWV